MGRQSKPLPSVTLVSWLHEGVLESQSCSHSLAGKLNWLLLEGKRGRGWLWQCVLCGFLFVFCFNLVMGTKEKA